MIGMFVGNKDTSQLVRHDAEGLNALRNAARTNAGINQKRRTAVHHQGRIATAATG